MRSRLLRLASSIAEPGPPDPPSDGDSLVTVMREISEETGGHAPALLALIERRQPHVEALDAARFILGRWRAGGEDRDRLIAASRRTPEEQAAERVLALEIQGLLKKHAGKAFSMAVCRQMRRELVQFLRRRLPAADVKDLARAADGAIDFRSDRVVIKLDRVAPLLTPRRALDS